MSKNNKTNNKTNDKINISDDTLDELETEISKFKDTKDLSDKVKLYNKLDKTIDDLKTKANDFIKIIDNMDNLKGVDFLDIDDESEEDMDNYYNNNDEDGNKMTESTIYIEKMVKKLNEEEILDSKIKLYGKIIRKIELAKSKCNINDINLFNIN